MRAGVSGRAGAQMVQVAQCWAMSSLKMLARAKGGSAGAAFWIGTLTLTKLMPFVLRQQPYLHHGNHQNGQDDYKI